MDGERSYELMDVDSGNLVGSFATEDEARRAARSAYERFGPEGVEDLILIRVDGDGEQRLVVDGEAVVAWLLSGAATT